jgi:hypothetical protein
VSTASLDFAIRRRWMSVWRPHAAAFVAAHDAPLIGERAATRGRSATEGGDAHADAKSALLSWGSSLANAHGERRDQGRARSSITHSAAFVAGNDAS